MFEWLVFLSFFFLFTVLVCISYWMKNTTEYMWLIHERLTALENQEAGDE